MSWYVEQDLWPHPDDNESIAYAASEAESAIDPRLVATDFDMIHSLPPTLPRFYFLAGRAYNLLAGRARLAESLLTNDELLYLIDKASMSDVTVPLLSQECQWFVDAWNTAMEMIADLVKEKNAYEDWQRLVTELEALYALSLVKAHNGSQAAASQPRAPLLPSEQARHRRVGKLQISDALQDVSLVGIQPASLPPRHAGSSSSNALSSESNVVMRLTKSPSFKSFASTLARINKEIGVRGWITMWPIMLPILSKLTAFFQKIIALPPKRQPSDDLLQVSVGPQAQSKGASRLQKTGDQGDQAPLAAQPAPARAEEKGNTAEEQLQQLQRRTSLLASDISNLLREKSELGMSRSAVFSFTPGQAAGGSRAEQGPAEEGMLEDVPPELPSTLVHNPMVSVRPPSPSTTEPAPRLPAKPAMKERWAMSQTEREMNAILDDLSHWLKSDIDRLWMSRFIDLFSSASLLLSEALSLAPDSISTEAWFGTLPPVLIDPLRTLSRILNAFASPRSATPKPGRRGAAAPSNPVNDLFDHWISVLTLLRSQDFESSYWLSDAFSFIKSSMTIPESVGGRDWRLRGMHLLDKSRANIGWQPFQEWTVKVQADWEELLDRMKHDEWLLKWSDHWKALIESFPYSLGSLMAGEEQGPGPRRSASSWPVLFDRLLHTVKEWIQVPYSVASLAKELVTKVLGPAWVQRLEGLPLPRLEIRSPDLHFWLDDWILSFTPARSPAGRPGKINPALGSESSLPMTIRLHSSTDWALGQSHVLRASKRRLKNQARRPDTGQWIGWSGEDRKALLQGQKIVRHLRGDSQAPSVSIRKRMARGREGGRSSQSFWRFGSSPIAFSPRRAERRRGRYKLRASPSMLRSSYESQRHMSRLQNFAALSEKRYYVCIKGLSLNFEDVRFAYEKTFRWFGFGRKGSISDTGRLDLLIGTPKESINERKAARIRHRRSRGLLGRGGSRPATNENAGLCIYLEVAVPNLLANALTASAVPTQNKAFFAPEEMFRLCSVCAKIDKIQLDMFGTRHSLIYRLNQRWLQAMIKKRMEHWLAGQIFQSFDSLNRLSYGVYRLIYGASS